MRQIIVVSAAFVLGAALGWVAKEKSGASHPAPGELPTTAFTIYPPSGLPPHKPAYTARPYRSVTPEGEQGFATKPEGALVWRITVASDGREVDYFCADETR